MTEIDEKHGLLQTSVKKIPFNGVDGRRKGYVPKEEFMEVFRAFMEAKGCEKAMDEDLIVKHSEAKDKTVKEVADDLKMDAVVRIAYKSSCEGTPFALIRRCESAYAMTQVLKKRYDPSDMSDVLKLSMELENCKLRYPKEDPTNFLCEVENKNALLSTIGEEHAKPLQQLQLFALSKLPTKKYMLVKRDLNKLAKEGETVSWQKFQDDIYEHWKEYVLDYEETDFKSEDRKGYKHLSGNKFKKAKNNFAFPRNTSALNVNPGGPKKYGKSPKTAYKYYKGRCTNCNEYGHKAKDCPEKPGGGANKMSFKGNCFVCGEKGHRAADCPKRNNAANNVNRRQTGMFVGTVQPVAKARPTDPRVIKVTREMEAVANSIVAGLVERKKQEQKKAASNDDDKWYYSDDSDLFDDKPAKKARLPEDRSNHAEDD